MAYQAKMKRGTALALVNHANMKQIPGSKPFALPSGTEVYPGQDIPAGSNLEKEIFGEEPPPGVYQATVVPVVIPRYIPVRPGPVAS